MKDPLLPLYKLVFASAHKSASMFDIQLAGVVSIGIPAVICGVLSLAAHIIQPGTGIANWFGRYGGAVFFCSIIFLFAYFACRTVFDTKTMNPINKGGGGPHTHG